MVKTLWGPSHPEMFREQVGRYGDRFYVDRLPADELHTPPSPVTPLPSISVIKSAFPKFLTTWASRETAQFAYQSRDAWKDLDEDAAVSLIAGSSNRTRDRAAERGSDVHKIIEDLCQGVVPDPAMVNDRVRPYFPAIMAMVQDLQLQPRVAEAVVFNHEVGYGGTFDFLGDTVLGRGLLDWKTREKAQPYDEEAGQVIAYANAEYFIVEEDGRPRRERMWDLDFCAVVVITPDTYKVFEVNPTRAWKLWTTLAAFWYAKKDRDFYLGTMPVASMRPTTEQLVENLRERINAMPEKARAHLAAIWPHGLRTLKQNPDSFDLIRIGKLVDRVEGEFVLPFAAEPETDSIDEGDELDDPTLATLMRYYEDLDPGSKQAVDYYLDKAQPPVRIVGRAERAQAAASGNVIKILRPTATVRRFEIYRALMALAIVCNGDTEWMARIAPLHSLPTWSIDTAREVANRLMHPSTNEQPITPEQAARFLGAQPMEYNGLNEGGEQ